jgi:hypothetical protein
LLSGEPVPHGMIGSRSRNKGDKHVGTIEEQNGVNHRVRSDALLDTPLARHRVDSLSQLQKVAREEN